MNNDLTNLERTILRIEDTQYYTLCNIDTIVRIDEPEEKLYTCNNCVFNDTIVCTSKIRTLIDYESVLV